MPASRIRVIHHGVVPAPIPDLPREKIVLCVGRDSAPEESGCADPGVSRVAARLDTRSGRIAGIRSRGSGREAAEQPAANRIRITGYVTDEQIGEWYARAGIFAFPSLDEGFGMPVLEAMAAGIPVIAGNRSRSAGGLRRCSRIDRSSQTKRNSLRRLLRLATDETRRTELVSSGFDAAQSNFDGKDAVSRNARRLPRTAC